MFKCRPRLDNKIWEYLIMRGGLLDDNKFKRKMKRKIENNLYEEDRRFAIKRVGDQRWRDAKSPSQALEFLLGNGVSMQFIKDHIDVIARNFIWEKQSFNQVCLFGKNFDSIKGVFYNLSGGIVLRCTIDKSNFVTTPSVGVVAKEILKYHNYIQREADKIKVALSALEGEKNE